MKNINGVPVYETLREIIDPAHSCLVIWDVQNALVSRIFNKDEFTKNLKNLTSKLRGKMPLIYSKITLPPKGFASSWQYYWWMKMFNVSDPKDIPWFMAAGSKEMEIYEDIKPGDNDIIIDKATASMFIGTYFEYLLRNRGITTVLFAGISTEVGIESSARDAANRGFYPVVVSDCVSSTNAQMHENSLKILKNLLIVEDSQAILDNTV